MKITKTNKKAIQKFSYSEWGKLDLSHFGRVIEWIEKDFCFKITDKTKIAGVINGSFKGGVILIDELIIADTYRGKGVGKKLMNKIFSYARQNKAHKIYLYTGFDWPSNIFYQKLGFQKIGEISNYYLNHDYVIYEMCL